jgi:predicted PurR-regulated permease PerM
MGMQTKNVEQYFFFALLLVTLIFTFLIFRPFWVVLVLGVSFATVLYPMHRWMARRIPNWLSALITVILFTVVLCGPLLGIGALIYNQSEDAYHKVVDTGSGRPFLDKIERSVNKVLPASAQFDIDAKISDFVSFVSKNVANIFTATVSAFFSFLLMLLIIFYFLKDGKGWKEALVVFSPLADMEDEKIISRFAMSINAVIKGYLLIALVQGILMGIGLWIFNIPNPALWGVVAGVASLVPTIGTAFVSVPAIIYLFVSGHTAQAVGLLLWAALAVGMIDNLLNPLIIGKQINIPPLLILFAVLGGISFLGPVGVLVGPLTLSLLYTLISIYRNDFKQTAQ